ncbi:hypothetical protein [Ensifer aridi]|uniref:hypothetical protein n=1 Tax=Ensifer aridi TaxID=1708715 RepID=UPI0015E417E8|nr:hypothetical protein [Ensifer aridi]
MVRQSGGIDAGKSPGMRVFAFAGGGRARTDKHRKSLSDLSPDVLFDDMDEPWREY